MRDNSVESLFDQLNSLFSRVFALVAGDIMLDEYVMGTVTRISPEAPVPVIDVQDRRYVLGGAANVAANIAALGSHVAVCGLAATDEAGQTLRDLFRRAGIGTESLVDAGERGTICKSRIVVGRQQIARLDRENKKPLPPQLSQLALASVDNCLPKANVLVLSDYSKGLLTDSFCDATIAAAQRSGIPVVVDPKSRDFSRYKGCTLITPNLLEAGIATGITIDSETALFAAGDRLRRTLPGSGILITRGPDGMTLFDSARDPVTVPAVARQVFDVVGAGDTVVAVLATCMGAGMGLEFAMRLANVAAGLVVDKPGTATVTVDEILTHDCLTEAEAGLAWVEECLAATAGRN